jgi:orotidine-5'-phosphate decarboxylase
VLEATKDYVAAVKINFQLLLPFGLDGLSDLIGYCAESGLPLIADIKLNDISSTNLDAAEQLYDSGFHAIIANPFVGFRDGLEPIIQYAHSRGEGIILLVYMSHKGASEGYSMRDGSGMPMFLLFAQRAKRWHADGVIVSAKSPQKIRAVKSIVGDQVLVLSPGVGAQGGDARKAFDAGAEFIIVGRTVLESSDPGRTIRGLNYFPHRASF